MAIAFVGMIMVITAMVLQWYRRQPDLMSLLTIPSVWEYLSRTDPPSHNPIHEEEMLGYRFSQIYQEGCNLSLSLWIACCFAFVKPGTSRVFLDSTCKINQLMILELWQRNDQVNLIIMMQPLSSLAELPQPDFQEINPGCSVFWHTW